MGKSGRYTQTRRLVMQGVMVLVLGATVGLAALVQRYRAADWRVDLAEPVELKNLLVRMPARWELSGPEPIPGGGARLMARPDGDEAMNIRLVVSTYASGAGSVEAVLRKQTTRRSFVERIEFLNHPGRLVEITQIVAIPNPAGLLEYGQRRSVTAMVKLRSGYAVTVELTGQAAFGPSARDLVMRVAKALALHGADAGPESRPTATEPSLWEEIDADPVEPTIDPE